MVFISFPGLGIDEFSLNRVAFSVGRLEVRWYGIIIVLGIITAFLYAHMRSKEFGVSFDDLLDVALYTVIAGIVGARIYYVLSKLDSYTNFWDVFKIWEGGIAIYGAIIGGGLALFIVSRIKKLDIPSMFDAVAPGVMIAQAIGRWGNFFNQEVFGKVVSEPSLQFFPYAVYIERLGEWHVALFFFEMVANLIVFALLFSFLMNYKGRRNWYAVSAYFIAYGTIRAIMEPMRDTEFNMGSLILGLPIMSWFSILVIAGGAAILSTLLVLDIKEKNYWWKDLFKKKEKPAETAEADE